MRMSAQQGAVVAFELPYDASMIMFSTTLRKDLTCLMLGDLISIFFSFLYQLVCQSQSSNLMFISECTSRLQTARRRHQVGTRCCFSQVKSVHTSILFSNKNGLRVRNHLLVDKNSVHDNDLADGKWSIKRNWVKWCLKKKKKQNEKGAQWNSPTKHNTNERLAICTH